MSLKKLLSKKSQMFSGIETTPLINWIMLNSKSDLRYLLKNSLDGELDYPKKKLQKLLIAKFEEIQHEVYNIIGVDVKVLNSYTRYMNSFLEIERNNLNNKIRRLEGLEPLRVRSHKNSILFYEYIGYLEKSYTDFEFYKYSFVDDFEKKYIEYYGIEELPELLKKTTKEITAWFTLTRYNHEIRLISDDLVFQNTMFSDNFIKNFVKKEVVKINELTAFAKRLEKGYYLDNKSKEWLLHRREYFNYDTMRFAHKTDSNISAEVAEVESALGYGIDSKVTMVSDYYYKIKNLVNKAKQAEKEANKNAPTHA